MLSNHHRRRHHHKQHHYHCHYLFVIVCWKLSSMDSYFIVILITTFVISLLSLPLSFLQGLVVFGQRRHYHHHQHYCHVTNNVFATIFLPGPCRLWSRRSQSYGAEPGHQGHARCSEVFIIAIDNVVDKQSQQLLQWDHDAMYLLSGPILLWVHVNGGAIIALKR